MKASFSPAAVLGSVYLSAMLKASERMAEEMADAKNKRGVVMRYSHLLPQGAWDGDRTSDFDPLFHAHWLGARAVEIDMRDKLIEFSRAHGIELPFKPS